MVSILIPTYDFDITTLVKAIHEQVLLCDIPFEILAYDDGSRSLLNTKNKSINQITGCVFKELPNNIGRSAIRNLLAKDSTYDTLLFIDAGISPKHPDFIKNYVALENKDVASGGMIHLTDPPTKPYKLRWLYTKKREQLDMKSGNTDHQFHSSNFLVQKSILEKFPFDESLKGYGYEDVAFYNSLLKSGIHVHFFNNPVVHMADDTSIVFVEKTENALNNLYTLISNGKLEYNATGITRYYIKLKRLKLDRVFAWTFKVMKPLILFNLHSSWPSLRVFDMYRLGYFCNIKNES